MTKYYSEEQVRDMFEPPAKFYDFEKVAKDYLEAEFEDVPALEVDENKKLVQFTDEQIFNFKRAIEHLYWETGEEDTLIDLLKTLGIEYDSHTYWN